MKYLTPERYFAIVSAPEILGPDDARRIAHFVTGWDAVTSACFTPADRVGDGDMFPSLCEKCAVLGWRLTGLGLPEAPWMARAALLSMLDFVQGNDGLWVDLDDTAALQTSVMLRDVMERRLSLNDFTQWVCAQIIAPI
jgi:hypothetical protein